MMAYNCAEAMLAIFGTVCLSVSGVLSSVSSVVSSVEEAGTPMIFIPVKAMIF